MKQYKYILIALLLGSALTLSAQANSYYRFLFSDTDRNQWRALKNADSVNNPSQICTNACDKVGSNNHTNNGVWYTLLNDSVYTNGVLSVALTYNGTQARIGGSFGWDIDHQGNTFLMSPVNESDPDFYLWQLDLETGVMSLYWEVGPWCCTCPLGCRQNQINGMVIQQFP